MNEEINFPPLEDIPEKKREEFSRMFRKRKLVRNEILFLTGEKWETVYFIHRGVIRLYYTDMDGREHNKGFYHENQLLWPVAPSAREDASLFSMSSLEEAEVSSCSFSSFYQWMNQHSLWEGFALSQAEDFIEDKFRREYEFLMLTAPERYRRFTEENPHLVKRIPDYHLASYLGMTNVTLSRIKNRF